MADHELEADDQRDGDYEYEEVDEGEYNVEGAENADLEEEYLDDEDGDDFAMEIVSSKLSPPAVQGGSKEAMEKENIYVHPLVKRSSSSEKSLELCTENLGNETGTGINEDSIFLLPSSDSKDGNFRTREQTKSRQLFETKKANPPNFPSSLTTISGSESPLFRPHRENGRLIINAVKAPATQSYFQAERSHGRLRLCFLKTCTPSVDSEEAKDEENEAAMNTVMERRDLTLTLLKKNHKWKKKEEADDDDHDADLEDDGCFEWAGCLRKTPQTRTLV
ncbi:Protein FANTASTIC FOUR 3 [Morella rubra]|uniref:Protein FANTASTIC FOUR 3 n=1 Tax=Morella rubra TaxID=262757 RepID=A0A6A1WR85_9ROSI|nr:Protein FANTASTIC FOUR 3 [Morella rubra]